MFKKPTKKQFIIRRIVLSTIATTAVVGIVTVAILSMLGYRLNSTDGTLQQGALLQFDSRPGGADVTVDGFKVGGRTATKQAVVAGVHNITMSKAGYEDWSRQLTVAPGTLTWLNYPRLVPKNRTPEKVASYGALSQLEFSPDLKWALAHEEVSQPIFQLIDLRSQEVKTATVTLPETLYVDAATPDVAHSFSIVRWNKPSRHVLVKHAAGDKQEWLVIDTQDVARSVNVTRLLSADFKDLQFAGTNGSSLYGLTQDGIIRKIDLSEGTMTRGFISHVDRFEMFATNIIVYNGVHPDKVDTSVVGVYRDGDESSNILREAPVGTPLHIATSQYFGSDYVAITEGAKVTILKGSYPSAQTRSAATALKSYASFTVDAPATALSFSPGGEYVIARHGDSFTTYEIEYKRLASADTSATTLRWLDEAHLWSVADGKLVMRDFDGTNGHAILPAVEGYGASLSQNGRYIYSVAKQDDTLSLQRVRMILE